MNPVAKKRFGQHFLTSAEAINRILAAAGIREGDRVLEIGPGPGALTAALRISRTDLTAVELDRDMAALLRERWPDLRLVEQDAMRVDWDTCCPGTGWKVVANLPYNVASPILLRLLDEPARFPILVLMFQKEVADRILAPPGSRVCGSLSLQVQARASVRRVLDLAPGAFRPPPKVDSTVLRLDLLPSPDFGGVPPRTFDRVVRTAFAQRRKTLHNALSSLLGRDRALDALTRAGIDPQVRAEKLGLAEFRRIARACGEEILPAPEEPPEGEPSDP